jgi:ABC-type antimicrobial peptide transport system permease subunit
MFFTYLRRELGNRKKQTIIIALGMALAIALVVIVNGFAAGVKTAQTTALSSVYGVGTDITVTKTAAAGSGGGQRFAFGSGGSSSSTSGGTTKTNLAKSNLTAAMGTATYASTELVTVQGVSGVKAATATLSLTNSTFSGSIQAPPSGTTGGTGTGSGTSGTSGTGGASGGSSSGNSTSTRQGPSSFSVNSFTVTGISTSATAVGPMSATSLSSGRYLTASDNGKDVVVLDATYAKTKSLTVGKTLTIGSTKFTVVGIVKSASSSSATASNSYIPLDTAQKVSGLTGKITNVYVTASSSSSVASVKSGIEKAFPSATVSTEAQLASTISGSLSTVSNLLTNLGTWLSVLVLAAAFAIAILFTISGVSRRTREFGTLKAIGWSNGRIVRQVAGESLVNGLIGGIIGAVVGIAGILIVNAIAPTLSSSAAASTATRGPGGAGGFGGTGGPGGAVSSAASTATSIALHIPLGASIILLAVGLAVLGGLIAGAFGGWRASRLRPAAALRSVA